MGDCIHLLSGSLSKALCCRRIQLAHSKKLLASYASDNRSVVWLFMYKYSTGHTKIRNGWYPFGVMTDFHTISVVVLWRRVWEQDRRIEIDMLRKTARDQRYKTRLHGVGVRRMIVYSSQAFALRDWQQRFLIGDQRYATVHHLSIQTLHTEEFDTQRLHTNTLTEEKWLLFCSSSICCYFLWSTNGQFWRIFT